MTIAVLTDTILTGLPAADHNLSRSDDTSTWTAVNTPVTGGNQSVAYFGVDYAPALDAFVAVSTSANSARQILRFRRGGLISQPTSPEVNNWMGVAWSPTLGLFAAVASSGTHRVMTSPDGTNWTVRTAASASDWQCIAWSEDLGLFVAMGTNVVMTSPDGITWTSRTAPSNNQFFSVVWCGGTMQKFVATALTRLATSTDGITWTDYASSNFAGNIISRVAYSPDLDQVLVTQNSGPGAAYISSTALAGSWTSSSPGNVRCACWSHEFSVWVAAGSSGHITTSPDGLTWTSQTPNRTDVSWDAIVEGILPPGQMGVEFDIGISDTMILTLEKDLPAVAFALGFDTTINRTFLDTTPSRDILISWLRRDRIDIGALFVTDNVPMSEASEKYDVEIIQVGSVVRTFTGLTTNSVLYTAAMQAADGWTQQPDQITVKVYQISAVVGRGFAGEVTVDVE